MNRILGVPRRGTPALFLLLALLRPLPVAAEDLASALDRGRYQGPERSRIEEFFAQSAAMGVPGEALLPRVQEAAAKSAPAGRLLSVLERERSLLLQARDLLQATQDGAAQLADPASWSRTANLLNSGLTPREVSALVRACGRRPAEYRPASYLYVALLDWGLPAEAALALVDDVLDSSLPGPDFPGIVDLLAEGRRRRLPLEQSLERLRTELPRTRGLADLRRRLY